MVWNIEHKIEGSNCSDEDEVLVVTITLFFSNVSVWAKLQLR